MTLGQAITKIEGCKTWAELEAEVRIIENRIKLSRWSAQDIAAWEAIRTQHAFRCAKNMVA